MFSTIWDFLKGIVSRIWAVVSAKPKPSVSADRGSIAAGGNITGNPRATYSEPSKPRSGSKRSKP